MSFTVLSSVQTKDAHIKLVVTHITNISSGNYNRKKEIRITGSKSLTITTCTPEDSQLDRNM
jgi:hypothetical protein